MSYVTARGATLDFTANTLLVDWSNNNVGSIALLDGQYDNLDHRAGWDFYYGIGNDKSNIIQMGDASNELSGGGGDDVLIGGGGADVFIVKVGEGSDAINDFNGADGDRVRLVGYGFNTFAEVRAALTQDGADVKLQLSPTEFLVFRNHTVADFTADNFQYELDRTSFQDGNTIFKDDFSDLAATQAKWATTYLEQTGIYAHQLTWNGEKQYYADFDDGAANPFSLTADGTALRLTVKATPSGFDAMGQDYVSGLLTTYETFEHTYGYFEMRADLPAGPGLWPAFWLLPKGDWPSELDVMEVLGRDPNVIYTTWHSETHSEPDNNQTQGPHTKDGHAAYVGDLSTGFHTFGVMWGPDVTIWYVDNAEVYRSSTPADLHDKMYLIANLAISSGWGGGIDKTTPFPSDMVIDYIRAWNLPSAPTYLAGPASTSGNDILHGTAASERIVGGGGSDTLIGGGGPDELVGGAGDDRYVLSGVGDHIVELAGEGIDTVEVNVSYALAPETGNAAGAGPSAVENVVLLDRPLAIYAMGNGLDNQLTGNSNANELYGMMGADTLLGTGGNDTLGGGLGDDRLDGGDGIDLANYDGSSAAVTVNLATGTATGMGSDTLVNIEQVLGTGFGDFITGSSGADTLDGGWGDDTLNGGDGDDRLNGAGQSDRIDGGAGVDTAVYDHAQADYDIHGNADGTVTIELKAPYTENGVVKHHTDVLSNVERADFNGQIVDLTVYGNGGNPPPSPPPPPPGDGETLVGTDTPAPLTGHAGDDRIVAGTGNDTLTGGAGADTFVFRHESWSHSVVTDFGNGADVIDLTPLFAEHSSYAGADPVGAGFLMFTEDGAGNVKIEFDPDGPGSNATWPFFITTINGASRAAVMAAANYPGHQGSGGTGGTGSNPGETISGTDSPGPLTGHAGDDLITAGTGNDTLTGAGGADTFTFRNLAWSHSVVTDFAPATDWVDLRPLFSEHAIGFSGQDPIAAGYLSFQDDGAGGLKIYFDPDGSGSNANWPFFITTIEHTTEGQALAHIAYPSHVPSGFGAGSGGSGSAPGVTRTGNDTPQTLEGGAGSDTLVAGSGNDTMIGHDGADSFVFGHLSWSHSVVKDFADGSDKLDFRQLFAQAGYTGSNPVADGWIAFQDDGAGGTKVMFDPDGPTSNTNWPFYITDIEGVAPSALTEGQDWIWH